LAFLESTYAVAAELGGWANWNARLASSGGPALCRASKQKEIAVTSPTGSLDQSLTITRDEHSSKGRYVVRVDGAEAEMTYSRAGERIIIIDHTGVPEALRGRHVGEALVQRGVEDARMEGRKIIPLCPFAKALISRHPEWQDVLTD
jgi:predicted GNAT family acetyltransferase